MGGAVNGVDVRASGGESLLRSRLCSVNEGFQEGKNEIKFI